jgi:hypothetical protein
MVTSKPLAHTTQAQNKSETKAIRTCLIVVYPHHPLIAATFLRSRILAVHIPSQQ